MHNIFAKQLADLKDSQAVKVSRLVLGLFVLLFMVACSSPADIDPVPAEEISPFLPPPGTETREVSITLPGATEPSTYTAFVIDGEYVLDGDMIVGEVGDEAALRGCLKSPSWGGKDTALSKILNSTDDTSSIP